MGDQQFEALSKYGQDLTAKAARLDPVIGRDEEIRRSIRILCRRTKNNPVLIGEPGVYLLEKFATLHSQRCHSCSYKKTLIIRSMGSVIRSHNKMCCHEEACPSRETRGGGET